MKEENRHYSFFQNRQCEYFPCHKGIDEEKFNCLFCYCPLYMLGKACGGCFVYNARGDKVCTDCTFPHLKENYDKVLSRYGDIRATLQKNDRDAAR